MNLHSLRAAVCATMSTLAACLTVSLCSSVASASLVAPSPPDGSTAPPIVLPDLGGKSVSTAALAPRPLVLIFGELTHDGVKRAASDVLDVLAEPRLSGTDAIPIMLIAQDAPAAQLKDTAAQGRFPALILHDPKRDAFGAYRVLVLPTVVVIDGKGAVVHAMPGFLQRFKEILADAVLLAAGRISREQFAQTIDPKAQSEAHETVRADRLVHLGTELMRHKLLDLAEARFTEATTLSPGHRGATLGLGTLMLRRGKLDDAERLFRAVVQSAPESASIEGQLGLAEVLITRAGDANIAKAEAALKSIIDKDPRQAAARYLMAQIHEARGNTPAALAEYKQAAALALDRAPAESR